MAGEKLPERPDTPCVAVCSTTFDEICRGCGRTYIEVAHWVSMSAEQKEVVWQRILAQGYPRSEDHNVPESTGVGAWAMNRNGSVPTSFTRGGCSGFSPKSPFQDLYPA